MKCLNKIDKRWGCWLIIFGLFLLTYQFRKEYVTVILQKQAMWMWTINLFALLGLLILIINETHFIKTNLVWIMIYGLVCIPVLVSTRPLYADNDILNWLAFNVLYVTTAILPIGCIFIKSPMEGNDENNHKYNKIIYFLMGYNFIGGVWSAIDLVVDRVILRWIASFMSAESGYGFFAYGYDDQKRIFAPIGHALTCAMVANMAWTLCLIYRKRFHISKWLTALTAISSLLVIIYSRSRVGLMVFVLIGVVHFWKAVKILIAGAITVILAMLILGQSLWEKLIRKGAGIGFRVGYLRGLYENYPDAFKFFTGSGSLAEYGDTYQFAYEFPFIQVWLRYGFIAMVFIVIVPFFIVAYTLICKKKRFDIFALWIWLYGEALSYEGLSCKPIDVTFIFWFVTMLVIWGSDNDLSIPTKEKVLNGEG